MLQQADTIGVFQVESRAQMATLPRMKPRTFYDLVVEVAIIRPGPIVGRMVHPYLDRRNGREPVRYDHPSLEPILRARSACRSFRSNSCDGDDGRGLQRRRSRGTAPRDGVQALDRADGKNRSCGCATGWRATDHAAPSPIAIVRSITSFALYGFPESHAASFALIAYASAYLKCHHPAAFFAAMLNCYPLGFYHPATLVKDAQRHRRHGAADRCHALGLEMHAGKPNPLSPFPAGKGEPSMRAAPLFTSP